MDSYEQAFADAVAAGAKALDFSDGGAEPWRFAALDLLTPENIEENQLMVYGYTSDDYGASLNLAQYWLTDDSTIAWLMDNVSEAEPPPVITPPFPSEGEGQGSPGEGSGTEDESWGLNPFFGFKLPSMWWLLVVVALLFLRKRKK